MLLAVEGGFFSSSASKGLNLLLLGQNNEEKQMRVTPVNQETVPDLQLASGKNRIIRGCASFVCFGGDAAGTESPCPLKVGPAQKQEILPEPQDLDQCKNQPHPVGSIKDDDASKRKSFGLKSSLKKLVNNAPVTGDPVNGGDESSNKLETSCEKDSDDSCQIKERRKVQWTDNSGGELFEIREFEMSEVESDDEFEHGNGKTCSCGIM
ncbi:uncharacterized protein LOC127246692 [Andrographis paniculata]|uniref:uncharacterized protein LOC127246692 n=1 Tax=Andrographis paniculata TaxID=175694 RepID=UPI0021E98F4E|nr:uncharacterized protein LOC127246692 [Andrographis paniculata]XP_051124162.1 uncharacterized protein LOC127246692 [Andrographis paniculata]